jgi:hypothetical protein
VRRMAHWQTVSAEPVRVGAVTLTLQSQLLSIRLPSGGFVWHRPTAVLVARYGRTEQLAIPDPTRDALLAFAAAALALAVGRFFVILIRQRRRKR